MRAWFGMVFLWSAAAGLGSAVRFDFATEPVYLAWSKKMSAESVDSAQVYRFATLRLDYAAFASLRSDRKPARTSSERSRGCSHAAK
jgi:hypothetical protein